MKDHCFRELRRSDRMSELQRVHNAGKIAIGDYVKTALNEFGTVVDFIDLPGLVVLEDWQQTQFHAVEKYCTLVGGGK